MLSHDESLELARDYIYKRSIVLYQEEGLHTALADHLREGNALPKNDREFRPVVERFLRRRVPAHHMEEQQFQQMVDYYLLFGREQRSSRFIMIVIVLMALGLMAAVAVGAVVSFLSDAPDEELARALGTERAIMVVAAVAGLYYWASVRLRAMLIFVRIALLLAMILALLWLLNDQGVIDIGRVIAALREGGYDGWLTIATPSTDLTQWQ